MNFLPIAQLEMRAAARKPATYYARSATTLLAVAVGVGFLCAGFSGMMSAASAGATVFEVLTAGAYVLSAGQAMLLTCDCISQEKREGTLGLLFLTDLNGFDVVSGKLVSRISRPLYCLVAAFPAFGFCLLLGGVSLDDFFKVALALLSTLFYFAALGILVSACVWRERAAFAWGGLALLILGFLLPLWSFVLHSPVWLMGLPASALFAAMGPASTLAAPPDFTNSFLLTQALGWTFVVVASFLVPRSWMRGGVARVAGRKLASPKSPTPPASQPPEIRRPPLSPLPGIMVPTRPLAGTVLLVFVSALLFLAALIGPSWLELPAVGAMIFILHTVLKFQAASQAGRTLSGKRRNGELELLLTTPCDEEDILRGCLLGLKRGLLWPVLFVLAVDLALLIFGWWKLGIWDGLPWAVCIVVEVVWMLVNLYSLSWVALFLGMKMTNPAKAVGRALFLVVVLPWPLVVLWAALSALVVSGHRLDGDAAIPLVVLFVASLVFCNTYFTGWAINGLRDQFRSLAAQF